MAMTETNDQYCATTKLANQCDTELNEEEILFHEPGDLGISVCVADDGAVVVAKLLQLRGYGELSCPTLHAGDVLVAIDNAPIVHLSFAEVMDKLRATANCRPTRLEFVAVDRFESVDNAVLIWQQNRCLSHATRDDDPRFREGEFEVSFESLQPTGLRFVESYIMTNPLRLAHVENALFRAMDSADHNTAETSCEAMLNSILIRIGEESVLGAPVDDVMALLYDAESFPKALWFARTASLQENFQVLTLSTREQLKWLCFVPMEIMMEVPVVSYAALAASPSASTVPKNAPRRRTRSDGISEDHYLMAINGFPTLRISSSSNFTDNSLATVHEGGIVTLVNKCLEALLSYKRTLRFRDLKAYRQEFLAHAPLSPWQRRRRTQSSTADSTRSNSDFISVSAIGDESRPRHDFEKDGWELLGVSNNDCVIVGEQHPRPFYLILQERAIREELSEGRIHKCFNCSVTSHQDVSLAPQRRPPIQRYHGLANCEGVRAFTPIVSNNVKLVVVPDNNRSIGIQLETDVQASGRPVFKAFVRCDGPALKSQRVKVGDRILAVNGVSIDEIPMNLLLRTLHGEDLLVIGQEEPTATAPIVGMYGSRTPVAAQRRVLRLARGDDTGHHLPSPGLFGQARKFLALYKARLAIWKSSQSKTNDIE